MREATTPAAGADDLVVQGRRLINAEWLKPGKGQTDMAQDAAESLVAAGWRPPEIAEELRNLRAESKPATLEQHAVIAVMLADAKPVRDNLLVQIAESVRDMREHDHGTQREDWYCLNLAAFMGERMGPVLRRLLDAEVEAARLVRERTADEVRPGGAPGELGDQAEGLPTVLDPAVNAGGGEAR